MYRKRYISSVCYQVLLLICILSGNVVAQDFQLNITIPTAGENRFGVCDEAKTANFEIENISGSAISSTTLRLELPDGMLYVPASIAINSGSGISEANTAIPTFDLGNFSANEVKRFDILLEVNCSGLSLATGAATTTFDAFFTYTGGSSTQDESTSPFEIVKPSLSIPQIDGISIFDNPVLDASLGMTDTLDIQIVNGGQGRLANFEYYIVDHDELTLNDIYIEGIGSLTQSRIIADTTFYILDQAEIATANSGVGSPANDSTFFQFNESLIVKEVWTVTACNLSAEDIFRGVLYGCDGTTACEVHHNSSGVRFGFQRPDIEVGFYEWGELYPLCYAEVKQDAGYYLLNKGALEANKVEFMVWGSAYASVDTASVEFAYSESGPFFKLAVDSTTNGGFSAQTVQCLQNAGDNDLLRGARYKLNTLLPVGDTLFIRFQVYNGSDCTPECFIDGIYGNSLENIVYQDPCETVTYTESALSLLGKGVNFSNFGEGPIEAYSGVTNTNYYSVDQDLDNFFYNSPINCKDCYLEAQFTFDNGLDWTGTNGDVNSSDFFWVDKNGDKWIPDYLEYTDTNGSQDTLTVRWIGKFPGNFKGNTSSFMSLNYEGDCNESPCGKQSTAIVDQWRFITDPNCADYGDGSLIDCPDTLIVNLNCSCPGDGCLGLRIQTFTAERVNVGLGDDNNNTIPEAGETIDMSLIRTSRFIPSDTIQAFLAGVVHTDASFSQWDYAYGTVQLEDKNFLPLSGALTIIDADGGTYQCDVLSQFLDSTLFVTDISPGTLSSLGCSGLPPSFSYEEGDSVKLTVRFAVNSDPGKDLVPVIYQGELLTSDSPYGGTPYSCNVLRVRLYQVGFNSLNSGWGIGNNFEGCEEAIIHPMFSFLIGTNPYFFKNLDYFPFEVRNFATISQIKSYPNRDSSVNRINDLKMIDKFRVVLRPSISGSKSYDFFLNANSPYLTFIEDSVIFNASNWFEDNSISPLFDQGFTGLRLVPFMKATSETVPGERQSISTEVSFDVNSNIFNTSEIVWENTWSAIYTGGPELRVELNSQNEQLLQREQCFTIDVINAGTTPLENTWLSFQNESGSVIVQSLRKVSPDTVAVRDSLGIYPLGSISSAASQTYQLCVTVNNCDQDSMLILSGWDCEAYPITIEEAIIAERDTVYFQPITSELGMVIKRPTSADTLNLCDTVSYELELSSAQLGYLNNIQLQFELPLDVSYVSNSFELQYPIGQSWDTVADPINSSGNIYQINLSEQNAILDSLGLVGTTNVGENLFLVRFKTVTECGYASGSNLSFLSSAFNACGDLANYRTSSAEPVYLTNPSNVFVSNVQIQSDTLNPCNSESTELGVALNLANTSNPISSRDSIRITLPLGINYVPGSYTAGTNAVTSSPRIESINGQEYVYIDLVDGTTGGSNINFTIDIESTDLQQECREYEIKVEAFQSFSAVCQATGSVCDARNISDTERTTLLFEKADLLITDFEASSLAIPPDLEELTYKVDFTNNGRAVNASADIMIEFYDDVDNDGNFTSADDLLGSVVHTGGISSGDTVSIDGTISINAGESCQLLAVINPATTCTCSPVASFRVTAPLNATFTRAIEVCHNEATSIGPNPMNGFSYQWVSLNGSDTSKIGNTLQTPTSFQSANEIGDTISWRYLLRTIRGNCYAYDTLDATVYPHQFSSVSNTVCSSLSAQLAGPLGGSNYIWSPTTNLDDPTNPTTTVSSVPNAITYMLVYLDENDCDAQFNQTITPTSCANSLISGIVWLDNDVNGLRDKAEDRIADATIYLYSQGDLSSPIQIASSDSNGEFSFGPLPAGSYAIEVDPSSTGDSYIFTPENQGSDDEIDSDAASGSGFIYSIYLSNGAQITGLGAGLIPFVGSLPVTFFDFNVQWEDNDALIKWITASEINNDAFFIERSRDGFAYFDVAEIDGAGTTRKFREYEFVDQSVRSQFSNQIFYRLRQVDFDGTFSFSDIIVLRLTQETLIGIYPNPARDELFVRYLIERDESLDLVVRDQLGKKIYAQSLQGKNDQQFLELDVSGWASGLYFFELSNPHVNQVFKIIVQ